MSRIMMKPTKIGIFWKTRACIIMNVLLDEDQDDGVTRDESETGMMLN